jgi:hypothetical protein
MTMTTTYNVFASNVDNEPAKEESYKKILPAILAFPPQEVLRINLDIAQIIQKALGSLPEIIAQRAAIVENIPKFDPRNIDHLEDLTLALSHCDAEYLTTCESPDDLPGLAKEAYALRETLYGDATSLARRGLVNPGGLKRYSGQIGYSHVVQDLKILVCFLNKAWPLIQGKCLIQQSEIDHADRLSTRMERLAGLRANSPAAIAASADQRARAFTLFVNAYDQVRRAIQYVRWEEGDADDIAPSLYAGKKRATVSDKVETAEEAAPAPAAAPLLAPVPAPVKTPPATPGIGALKAPEAGSDPFLQ